MLVNFISSYFVIFVIFALYEGNDPFVLRSMSFDDLFKFRLLLKFSMASPSANHMSQNNVFDLISEGT